MTKTFDMRERERERESPRPQCSTGCIENQKWVIYDMTEILIRHLKVNVLLKSPLNVSDTKLHI